jgi:hypothetical protein
MMSSVLSARPIRAAVLAVVGAALLLMGQASYQNSAVYNVAGFAGADIGAKIAALAR